MREQDLSEMRALGAFADVDSQRIDELLKGAYLQRFPARVELVREGEPADFLHIVVDGSVEVYSAYRDRETTVAVLGPGNSFILAAVVLDRIYLKSARSLTTSRILLVPAEVVRRVFAEDAAFARQLAVELALAYRMVVKELKNQKLRSGLERLANWLLAQSAECGGQQSFELPFVKKVLAARLGMTPEVLSRSFAALVPYDVKVIGSRIEIHDVPALVSLAKPTPTIDDPLL
jgi:CRP/FNR family transcriptional activator FtrB